MVVATKKDEFMGVKMNEAREKVSSTGKYADEYLAALDEYSETQFYERMKMIEKEFLEIDGGRFDAALGVSISKSSH